MIIRVSDPVTDALEIMDGVRDFISRMDFTDCLPEDDAGIIDVVGNIVALEDVEVLVAEHEGKIVGILMMIYFPHLWNPKLINAEELLWWGSKDAPKTTGLRMLRFAKKRAKEKGAYFMTFTKLTCSPKNLGRVYERMGMREIETSYVGLL